MGSLWSPQSVRKKVISGKKKDQDIKFYNGYAHNFLVNPKDFCAE